MAVGYGVFYASTVAASATKIFDPADVSAASAFFRVRFSNPTGADSQTLVFYIKQSGGSFVQAWEYVLEAGKSITDEVSLNTGDEIGAETTDAATVTVIVEGQKKTA